MDIEFLELDSLTSVQPFYRKGLLPQFGDSSKHLRSVKEMLEKIDKFEEEETKLQDNKSDKHAGLHQKYTEDVTELL